MPMLHIRRSRLAAAASLSACLLGALPVSADVVELEDGRVFEGTVLTQSQAQIEIDTVVSTIRTQLTFAADAVASVEKRPLPAGFFAPRQGEASTSDRSAFADDATLYIEVPVVGTIGRDVLADGVHRALSYARRNAIGHVVFRVDSDGGSLDEMQSIVRVMKEYEGKMQMHALVSRSMGDALAVPMVCDTVTLLPGAVIGGSGQPIAEGADSLESDLEQTLRTDLARKASVAAQAKGRPGNLIRACIDPAEQVAAWEDGDGEVVVGRTLPRGVAEDKVIVEVGVGELLVLDGPTLKRLGAPLVQTDAAGLGETLGVEGWAAESDYGIDAMSKMVQKQQAIAERHDARSNAAIARNIQRREAADATLKRSVEQAAEWDPSEHSYATYQTSGGSHRWRRVRWNDDDSVRDTNRLTKQSRNEWAQRSDAAMGYLSQAAKAGRSLKKLDEEAIELGLEPTYGPEELDAIIQDLTVKWDFLSANRNKASK